MNAVRRAVRNSGVRRRVIAPARLCCERVLMSTFRAKHDPPRSRILCYHSVGTPSWGVNDVSPARFRRHLELALDAGYRFVPAEQIAAGNGAPNELAITFDDGLSSVAQNAGSVLADLGIPWTIFIVSGWSDGQHAFGENVILGWREVETLAAAGATIGSHSVTHPNFAWLEPDLVAHELAESRRMIAARTGIDPRSFAIPLGQAANWPEAAQKAAVEAGYTTIYAQAEAPRPAGTVPRTFITRFDSDRVFRAALGGTFDSWEEWL